MKPELSIIIPCYNEEKNIDEIYKEVIDINLVDMNIEIIFVNNGSKDNTEIEIKKIIDVHQKKNNKNLYIRLLNLNENQNYDGGIYKGLQFANGNFLSWTHGDLQTPIIDVILLYKKIKNKKKVFGKGFRTNNRGYDSIVSRMHEKLCSLILGFNMKEINAQPKIFEKKYFDIFNNPPKKYARLDTYFYYIALKKNFVIENMNVVFRSRVHGKSNWKSNFFDFIKHIISNTLYLIKLRLFN